MRKPRVDAPGMWHHVMHRGAARRTVFESRRDMRFFLAQLAKAVRCGWLEIHCFVLMYNHFHLLVRSLTGELSRAMGRVLNIYVRHFNRRRKRDGSLFRDRFLSKPVESLAYRRTLVRYIDNNPVRAKLAPSSQEYAWGSGRAYQCGNRGPIWLARGWIEAEVRVASGAENYAPHDYGRCFPPKLPESVCDWIDRGIDRGADDRDLDDLLAATPEHVRDWMERKARLADGTSHGQCVVTPEIVEAALCGNVLEHPEWTTIRGRRGPSVAGRDLALPGLLREIAGLSQREIAVRLGEPRSTVQDRLGAHRQATRKDPVYLARCAEIAGDALARMRTAIYGR